MRYINLFESYNKIEEIEDYFLELIDQSIKIEITDHNINKRSRRSDWPGTRSSKVKKYMPIKGHKISIFYDEQKSFFVNKAIDTVLKRLGKDYNIHYNQVSKRNNGYIQREVPVSGRFPTVAVVNDPKWKRTITISSKVLNELHRIHHPSENNELDIIEDFLDMSEYNNELDITGHYKHSFDILTKNIIGDNSRGKPEILYGSITNADIMKSDCESIVSCIISLITFKIPEMFSGGMSSKEYLLSRFKRLILLCPNIVIFYKMLASNGSIGNNPNSRLYEFTFFISPISDNAKKDQEVDMKRFQQYLLNNGSYIKK